MRVPRATSVANRRNAACSAIARSCSPLNDARHPLATARHTQKGRHHRLPHAPLRHPRQVGGNQQHAAIAHGRTPRARCTPARLGLPQAQFSRQRRLPQACARTSAHRQLRMGSVIQRAPRRQHSVAGHGSPGSRWSRPRARRLPPPAQLPALTATGGVLCTGPIGDRMWLAVVAGGARRAAGPSAA
jgi:hypothetical protein